MKYERQFSVVGHMEDSRTWSLGSFNKEDAEDITWLLMGDRIDSWIRFDPKESVRLATQILRCT